MPELSGWLHHALVIFAALFSVLLFGALVGGFVTSMLRGPGVDAAEIYYYDEPTVVLPPAEPVIAHRPMSAMERLEGPTRRIIRHQDGEFQVEPWWMGGRHRVPESRLRTAPYVLAPREALPTMEFPLLDWSARTEELTQVYQGGEQ
jgi:hypothetical protein